MAAIEMLRLSGASSSTTASMPSFRLLTWNVLAQCLIHRDQFPRSPHGALRWKSRKERLLNELVRLDPDVACLQEVDSWDSFWMVELGKRGFDYVYEKKMKGLHGCAIAWKTRKFRLLDKQVFYFDNSPLTHPTPVWPVTQNIGMLVALEHLAVAPIDNDNVYKTIVSNHHLYWRPSTSYVRLRQLYVLLDTVAKMKAKHNAPAMICGDFNATPYSPEYLVLTKHVLNTAEITSCEPSKQVDPFPGACPEGATVTVTKSEELVGTAASDVGILTTTHTNGDSKKRMNETNHFTKSTTDTNPHAHVHMVVDYSGVNNPLPVDLLLNRLAQYPKCRSVYATYTELDQQHHSGNQGDKYRSDVNEPDWTTYTEWTGTLDYIFCYDDDNSSNDDIKPESRLKLQPEELLRLPHESTVQPGIPNKQWGSDHIPLMCTVRWQSKKVI